MLVCLGMSCPEHVKKAYQSLFKQIEELEKTHHALPADSETAQGKIVSRVEDVDNLAKYMLERTTCIQKEIAKQMTGCNLFYLRQNPHIEEELKLMRKDLEILESAYRKRQYAR